MKLRSVMIRVYDIEKSLDFYTKVFGLKVIREKGEFAGAKIFSLAFNDNEPVINLCYNLNQYEKYTHGTHFGHIGFTIDSMDDFAKKLEELGLEFDREPFKTERGSTIAFLKDPDGIRLAIVEEAS